MCSECAPIAATLGTGLFSHPVFELWWESLKLSLSRTNYQIYYQSIFSALNDFQNEFISNN